MLAFNHLLSSSIWASNAAWVSNVSTLYGVFVVSIALTHLSLGEWYSFRLIFSISFFTCTLSRTQFVPPIDASKSILVWWCFIKPIQMFQIIFVHIVINLVVSQAWMHIIFNSKNNMVSRLETHRNLSCIGSFAVVPHGLSMLSLHGCLFFFSCAMIRNKWIFLYQSLLH